ncbi:MAG: enolase C-terminal domain-like protein [Caldilineaceae bacterium]
MGPVGYHLQRETPKGRASPTWKTSAGPWATKMEMLASEGARWDRRVHQDCWALEPYDVMWLEEIGPRDNVDAYARLKHETRSLCVSERLIQQIRLSGGDRTGRGDIIMPDMAWCGGIE